MSYTHKPTVIETIAEKLHLIADLHAEGSGPVTKSAAVDGTRLIVRLLISGTIGWNMIRKAGLSASRKPIC